MSVRLGDFGLATTHRHRNADGNESLYSEASSVHQGMDEARMFSWTKGSSGLVSEPSTGGESMTGGVGTTFYRAPEQEGKHTRINNIDSTSYTVQADIFSFGVILFEVFHPPFSTYMERSEMLTTLRGDKHPEKKSSINVTSMSSKDFKEIAGTRFPSSFVESVSENAQRYVYFSTTKIDVISRLTLFA